MTKHEKKKAQEQMGEGIWNQFSGRIQEAWGALTDDDVTRFEGRKDQLIGTIQEKTGEAREVIAEKLEAIAEEIGYRLNRNSPNEEKEREDPPVPPT